MIGFNADVVIEDTVAKDGIKDGITDIQASILTLMASNPKITAKMLSTELGVNVRNTEKNIKILRDKSYIERIGSNRSGFWSVANEDK